MTWIGRTAVFGTAFYIILMVIEMMRHPEIIVPAVCGSILLGGVAGVFVYKNEHKLHLGEMILLWAMIFLFVLYGALLYFGVIL